MKRKKISLWLVLAWFLMANTGMVCAQDIGQLQSEATGLVKILVETKHGKSNEATTAYKQVVTIGEPAVPILIKELDKPIGEISPYITKALVEMGEKSVPGLIEVLKDSSPQVQRHAVILLGFIRDERASDPLLSMLKNSKSEMKNDIVSSLGLIGAHEAVGPLMVMLQTQDSTVKQDFVIESLGNIGDTRATSLLLAKLANPDKLIRSKAALAIGNIADTRGVDSLFNRLKTEPDEVVCTHVAEALSKMANKETRIIPTLAGLAKSGKNTFVRGRLLTEILPTIKDPTIIDVLAEVLETDPDSYLRYCAVQGLRKIGGSKTIAALTEALKDKNMGVQEAARKALK